MQLSHTSDSSVPNKALWRRVGMGLIKSNDGVSPREGILENV